jgi:cytidine deaminase
MSVTKTSRRPARRAVAPLRELIGAARQASRRAYAPYSGLRVGAALVGADGRVYVGCNVENASFGLTICAERAAVFGAVAAGDMRWSRLLIYTPDSAPLSPCGACRQVLAEFCGELEIVSVGKGGFTRRFGLRGLLPEGFTLGRRRRTKRPAARHRGRRQDEEMQAGSPGASARLARAGTARTVGPAGQRASLRSQGPHSASG